jgi:hypothetical protein
MISFSKLGNFGRLGNQLFQIASTIGIAKSHGMIAKFPKWEYSKYFINQIDQSLEPFEILHQYIEPGFNYTKPVCQPNTDLVGYFQSEKYFKEHASQIREYFTFVEDLVSDQARDLCKDRCAIHVRRTDYLNLAEYHPFTGEKYYLDAIQSMNSFGVSKFIVFSDDISWCKQNFSKELDIVYAEGNSNVQDLSLMSQCQHNIIANSSFSWWGAWLNRNQNKLVIAPARWFGQANQHANLADLYCDGWLKINS